MSAKTKISRRASGKEPVISPARHSSIPWYLIAFAAALYLLFEAYQPALRGPFVFDDLFLPYADAHAAARPLQAWMGVRPVLGLSFWFDSQLWGRSTLPYHATNLVLHFSCGVLLFFIFLKLLGLQRASEPKRTLLAGFGALLFLLHPIQTEVAAYIASRSEALSVLFFLSAYCVFLYRRTAAIGWGAALGVLALFFLAIGSKEHVAVLPALLLLTDYFWNPGFSFAGIRANWRLYVPLAVAGVLGPLAIFRYLAADPAIGFRMPGLDPGSYFLTECRAIFKYLQLWFFPYSQNVDYDFPVSHRFADHGAIFAFGALLAAVAVVTLFRKAYPLAAFGFLAFLLLLSPTSSVVPIQDVLVERRVYLPFFALVLISFELLRRVRMGTVYLATSLALVCSIAGYATWRRAQVWGSTVALFGDAAKKSPGKARAHIGYANSLFHAGRCREAVSEYDAASHLEAVDHKLFFNWAAAYDCVNDPDQAVRMLEKSNSIKPQANTYVLLGEIEGRQGRLEEGLQSLESAVQLDPALPAAYAYRGVLHAAMGKPQLAYKDFADCLHLDPRNETALGALATLTQQK